jgi:hypothetical protein
MRMLRAEENEMEIHVAAFSVISTFSVFWRTFELNMRTSELKWSYEMSREHIELRLLVASDRGHLHLQGMDCENKNKAYEVIRRL